MSSELGAIQVPVPIEEDGTPSLDAQREIVEQSKFLLDLKKQLETIETEIADAYVRINNESSQFCEGKISDFFDIIKGSSKYTNGYILANPGPYPVFSSQTTDDGVMGRIASYDLDKECISWTTDGVHAGTVFLRNEKFSMTTHCGALVLKDEFVGQISYSYAALVLRNDLKKVAIGEQNKRVTVATIGRLPISFPTDGHKLDIDAQKSFAEKQEKIDRIKSVLCSMIQTLRNCSPIFSKS